MNRLWNTLREAKKLKWVELSHLLDNGSPYWSGIPEGSVELGAVLFASWPNFKGANGLPCRVFAITE